MGLSTRDETLNARLFRWGTLKTITSICFWHTSSLMPSENPGTDMVTNHPSGTQSWLNQTRDLCHCCWKLHREAGAFIRVGTGQRGIKVYNFRGNVTAELQLSESSFIVWSLYVNDAFYLVAADGGRTERLFAIFARCRTSKRNLVQDGEVPGAHRPAVPVSLCCCSWFLAFGHIQHLPVFLCLLSKYDKFLPVKSSCITWSSSFIWFASP